MTFGREWPNPSPSTSPDRRTAGRMEKSKLVGSGNPNVDVPPDGDVNESNMLPKPE